MFVFQYPVNEYVFDSLGELGWILISGVVNDGRGIENRDIREKSFPQQASISQSFPLRWERGDFPNCLLKRQKMFVTHVVAQKTRHGSEGARMGMRLEQWSIERHLIGIESDGNPWLFQAVTNIVLICDEVNRASVRLVAQHKIE